MTAAADIDPVQTTAPGRAASSGAPLLQVEELRVSFPTPDGLVEAVRGVSFAVERGRTLAIVGESGSGKSVATQTIIGLTSGARLSGKAIYDGRDLLAMSPAELRSVRGSQISMIFQNPNSSLHPLYRVGWQIEEMILEHDRIGRRAARARAIDLLRLVGIPSPERRVDDYPHQFSGGMLQRAMIAMAIALNPRLLIADEPTTALDVTVQAQILRLMRGLQKEFGTAIIMITHDLGVVAGLADEVMVMYAGRTMERAPPVPIYYTPHHPYTNGLLSSLPRADTSQQRLTPIRGQPPSMISPPAGCPFHPRCRFAMQRCHDLEPPLTAVGTSAAQLSSCWLPPDLLGGDPATDERREAYARGGRPAEATPEDPTRPVASGATAPRTA